MKKLLFLYTATLIIIIILGFSLSTVFAETSKAEGKPYKIGVNDAIYISVIGHKDLETLATVVVDGTISFPHLGTIYVKDKTLPEIEKEITEKLSEGFIKYPVVSVSLVKALSKIIFLHGEVGRPGMLPFEKDMTIIQALSIAGGIRESGLFGKVKIRRKQDGTGYKTIVETGLSDGIIMDSEVEDILLKPDDIVIVERSDTYFFQGEVANPGQYILESDMTVGRAITIAGGIREDGLYGKVKVRRKQGERAGYETIVEANLDKGIIENNEVEDMLLQPDDIVIIERNETYFIEGEITVPGQYVLESGMTVGRAITLAGGIAEGGLHGKIKVRREREESHGYEDIEVNLKGIIEGSIKDDIFLQPDDIVIIERSKTFLIYGEVNSIGEFALEKDMTVFKALTIAGGLNKWGSPNGIKVLRPTNDGQGFATIKVNIKDILNGDVTADVTLQPGDIIVVSSGIF